MTAKYTRDKSQLTPGEIGIEHYITEETAIKFKLIQDNALAIYLALKLAWESCLLREDCCPPGAYTQIKKALAKAEGKDD